MKIKKFHNEDFEKLSEEDKKYVYSEIVAGIALSILILIGGLCGVFELLKYLFRLLHS